MRSSENIENIFSGGELGMLFHGSPVNGIKNFIVGALPGSLGYGVYLSNKRYVAESYGGAGSVYAVRLVSYKKILLAINHDRRFIQKIAESKIYDGITDVDGIIVVFDPNSINIIDEQPINMCRMEKLNSLEGVLE